MLLPSSTQVRRAGAADVEGGWLRLDLLPGLVPRAGLHEGHPLRHPRHAARGQFTALPLPPPLLHASNPFTIMVEYKNTRIRLPASLCASSPPHRYTRLFSKHSNVPTPLSSKALIDKPFVHQTSPPLSLVRASRLTDGPERGRPRLAQGHRGARGAPCGRRGQDERDLHRGHRRRSRAEGGQGPRHQLNAELTPAADAATTPRPQLRSAEAAPRKSRPLS